MRAKTDENASSELTAPRRWDWLLSPRLAIGVVILVVLIITARGLAKPGRTFNNYDIFRYSYAHLVEGRDPYARHRADHDDFFKYSPPFAILMGPFWVVPRDAGVFAWNLLNALAPCLALSAVSLAPRSRAFVTWFALPMLAVSAHNAQSNGLVLASMIGAFAALERGQGSRAALFAALGTSIKPFALIIAALAICYRQNRFWPALVVGLGMLLIAPVFFVGMDGISPLYSAWFTRLAHDRVGPQNYSLMSLVQAWTGVALSAGLYVVIGLAALCGVLSRRTLWDDAAYRRRAFESMLLWVVIFNHKAESPTFVICAFGAGLWAVHVPRGGLKAALPVSFFLLTELAATDLLPKAVRTEWVQPIRLIALPAVLIWVVATWELMTGAGRLRGRIGGRPVVDCERIADRAGGSRRRSFAGGNPPQSVATRR